MRKPLSTLTLAISLSLLTACSSTSDQQNIEKITQGFRLSQGIEANLTVPTGFKLATEHYGFVQPETFSRIKLSEIETPYQTYLSKLSKENLLKNQLQLLKTEQVNVSGASCTLLKMRTLVNGNYFEKLWLLSGDKLSSVLVEASYPEGSSQSHKQLIKESLFSLGVKTNNQYRVFTGLPFYIGNSKGFRVVKRTRNSVIFESLKLPNTSVVFSHGMQNNAIQSTEDFGVQVLTNSKTLSEFKELKSAPIKLDKIPALETRTVALKSDQQHFVYQIVSAQQTKFLLMQAATPIAYKEKLFLEMESLIGSFRFK